MADRTFPAPRYAEWRPSTIRRVPIEWIGLGATALVLGLLVCFVPWGGYLQVLVAGLVGKWVSILVAERRLRGLRDDPNGGQFAATLVLEREVPYGYDEGLLAFEEGWLVFQGHRCTFSVGAGDVQRATTGAGTLRLVFGAPGGPLEAELKTRPHDRFTLAAKSWRAAGRRSDGPILPPRLPSENAREAGRTLVGVALVVGLPLAGGFARWGGHVFRGFIPAAVAAAVLCAAVRASEIGGALGRLERGEPRKRRFWERRPAPTSAPPFREAGRDI